MSVGVAILGSTGSIGCSALQVLARQRERFRVAALTAHSNADLLQRQATDWAPGYVGIANGGRREAGGGMRTGPECLAEAATHPDLQTLVKAIAGAPGLEATLRGLGRGNAWPPATKKTPCT